MRVPLVKWLVMPMLFGGSLAAIGFPITTPQYWLMTVIALLWVVWPEKQP